MSEAVPRPWLVVRNTEEWSLLAADHAPNTRLLVRSYSLQMELQAQGLEAELWEDAFPRDELAQWGERLRQLRSHWHEEMASSGLKAALQFRGVDLSEMLDYGVNYALVEILRNIATLGPLVASGPPTRVVVGSPHTTTARLLQELCEQRKIQFEAKAPEEFKSRGRRKGPKWSRAIQQAWTLFARARALRRQTNKLRILLRDKPRSLACVEARTDIATCVYDRGGKTLPLTLRVSSWLHKKLRPSLREVDTKLAQLRAAYRNTGLQPCQEQGFDLARQLRPFLDYAFLDQPLRSSYENVFGSGTMGSIAEFLPLITYAELLLDVAQPDVVLVHQDSSGLDKALLCVATVRDIPSAVLQHGIPAAYFTLRADRFLVWGEFCYEFYCDRYREPRSRLVVTGDPLSRSIQPTPASELDRARQDLGVPVDAKVILYIGQPSTGLTIGDTPVNWERQITALCEATRELDDTWLVVRPHPSEPASDYAAIAKRCHHPRFRAATELGLQPTLELADLIVLRDSTVSLDAIALGKKLLVLDLYDYDIELPFELDDIPIVQRQQDLEAGLRTALDDSKPTNKSSRFLQSQLQQSGEPAREAIYQTLRKLASEER